MTRGRPARRCLRLAELINRGLAFNCPGMDPARCRAAVALLAPRPSLRHLNLDRLCDLAHKLGANDDGREQLGLVLSVWNYAWRLRLVDQRPPAMDALIRSNPTPDEIAARAALVRATWPDDEVYRRCAGPSSHNKPVMPAGYDRASI